MSPRRAPARGGDAAPIVPVPQEVAPLLRSIGQAAEAEGLESYAVGGCVRDWLLEIPSTTDVDVTVVGDGIAFAKTLGRRLSASVISHEQFGTATIVVAGRGAPAAQSTTRRNVSAASSVTRIDVASCRRETYSAAAAYPKVEAGTLHDDLRRRDFTINAMAMALGPARFAALVDPFGGLADLRAARLRILHPNSFIDDPSRMLRAARFVPRLGVTLESGTARALRAALADAVLSRLNRGRLRKELDRMVEEPDPIACLALLGQWLQSAEKRVKRPEAG